MLAENEWPPEVDPGVTAFFLDFDGTLVGIAPRPDAVEVPAGLPDLLEDLHEAAGGALAVVSGRGLAELEAFLPAFAGALVGSHGAERRGRERSPAPEGLSALHSDLRRAAEAHGLHAELKAQGGALHFRAVPEREQDARAAVEALATAYPGFVVQTAKMAFELKPATATKDAAVAALMAGGPFAGRRPVYVGDDATDEPAMAWVRTAGGLAVKVGEGPSVAALRLPDPAAVLDWLDRLSGGR